MATVTNELVLFGSTDGITLKQGSALSPSTGLPYLTSGAVSVLTGTGVVQMTSGVPSLTSMGVYNPITDLVFVEDFLTAGNSAPDIGLGWTVSAGNTTMVTSEANHPGIITRDTGGTSGTHAYMSQRTFQANGAFDPASMWETYTILKCSESDANTSYRVGIANPFSSNPPSNGIFFERLNTDSNWFAVTRSGGTQTRTSMATQNTSWVKLRIRRIDASTIGFTIDSGSETTHTTNIPTAQMQVGNAIINHENAIKTMALDLISLKISGITR